MLCLSTGSSCSPFYYFKCFLFYCIAVYFTEREISTQFTSEFQSSYPWLLGDLQHTGFSSSTSLYCVSSPPPSAPVPNCRHNLHYVSLLRLLACPTTICAAGLLPTCVCQQHHHQTQSDQRWGNPQSYKGMLKNFSLLQSLLR